VGHHRGSFCCWLLSACCWLLSAASHGEENMSRNVSNRVTRKEVACAIYAPLLTKLDNFASLLGTASTVGLMPSASE
jgi:hypothetical protein